MSKDIRIYESIDEVGLRGSKDLVLTAFVGGKKYGHCIQFTIGREFTCLSEKQLLDMVTVILKRLRCEKGFSATEWGEPERIEP